MTTKRIVVGAHYGLRGWMGQRISAVYLAIYTIGMLIALLTLPELGYGTWAGLFSGAAAKVFTVLAVFAVIYHAWIGVRDIYMDYIGATGVRLALQMLTLFALLGYACWAVIILWRV